MPALQDSSTHSASAHLKRGDPKPTTQEVADAKALINVLMQDPFFLALYRSNDPEVRAAAFLKLDQAHYQAYGDSSTTDDEIGRQRK